VSATPLRYLASPAIIIFEMGRLSTIGQLSAEGPIDLIARGAFPARPSMSSIPTRMGAYCASHIPNTRLHRQYVCASSPDFTRGSMSGDVTLELAWHNAQLGGTDSESDIMMGVKLPACECDPDSAVVVPFRSVPPLMRARAGEMRTRTSCAGTSVLLRRELPKIQVFGRHNSD
jgi:hypothetical protein